MKEGREGGGRLSVAHGQAAARQGRVDADGCDIDRPALTVHAHQGPNMDSVMLKYPIIEGKSKKDISRLC